jgi:predicted aspartyl protease
VNGNKAVPFLVDTGASTTVLDIGYAKSIGVLSTSEEYLSLQGHPMRDVSIDEMKIGTFGLESVRARVMNLGSVLGDDCPAKGILGYPIFRELELSIDYPKRTISLREGAYRRLERSFEPVFTFVVVPVLVENQGPFNFILDTGANMSLVEAHVLGELNPPKEEVPVVRIKMDGPGEGFGWPRKGGSNSADKSRSEGINNAREFIRRACGIRIDGTVGWRHMKDYKITINYLTCTYQFEKTGYAPELKPAVVDVSPDVSKDIHSGVKEVVFQFSVPMRQVVSYFTTFECKHRWQDDKHLKLIILEDLEVDKGYEIILGHGFLSKEDVPLDWTPYRFKVVSNQ